MGNKKYYKTRAFSLIELSIVILIIGIVIIAIIGGKKLVTLSNLTKARQLTNSSPVNGIEDLAFWVESTSKNSFIPGEGVNGAISQWNDLNTQSNIKRNITQSTAGNKPVYVDSSVINGLPAVRFASASSQYLSSANSFEIGNLTNKGQFTAFVVMNMTSGDNLDIILYFASEPNRIVLDSYYWDYGNGGRLNYGLSLYSLGNIIMTTKEDGATQYVYINGVQKNSGANAISIPAFSANLFIGGAPSAGAFYIDGDVGEIIIYNRALSDFERAQIEQYLSKKWGIKLT